jgi:ribonuclease R
VSRPRKRGPGRITGNRAALVSKRGRFLIAEPLFERGAQVTLERGGGAAKPDRIAMVDFRPGGGRFLRELGSPEVTRDVIEALLADRGYERGFSKAVRAEASRAVAEARERGDRPDLTELATFTVDPATARDFDDAVSAKAEGDGVRLWIHIADVAAHVRPDGALEAEAYRRGTSTYVPGSVEPMLPAELSNDACSLAPGVPRLAVTTELEISGTGEVGSARFYRSLIRSDARLDYDQLDEIFAGRERPPDPVAEPLELARRTAAALAAHRPLATLSVETPEPEFHFEDGHVAGVRMLEHTEAHRLIEQFMITTNEQVAALLEQKRVPALYRVHEQPDGEAIERLVAKLEALDVPTPPLPERLAPSEAGEYAGEASRLISAEARRRGHGLEAYTSLLLRSMKQAYYTHRNVGHAGLGSSAYTHFTSPIRRYPDLIAHRALLSAVGEGEERPRGEHVREAGPLSSDLERAAMGAERSADDICAAFLLRRELFDSGWDAVHEGEVSGLVGAGAFVRFGEIEAYEGFLPARLLPGERFDLNDTETALVGKRSGRALRLGDPVQVRVDAVDAPRGRVDLTPVEVEES